MHFLPMPGMHPWNVKPQHGYPLTGYPSGTVHGYAGHFIEKPIIGKLFIPTDIEDDSGMGFKIRFMALQVRNGNLTIRSLVGQIDDPCRPDAFAQIELIHCPTRIKKMIGRIEVGAEMGAQNQSGDVIFHRSDGVVYEHLRWGVQGKRRHPIINFVTQINDFHTIRPVFSICERYSSRRKRSLHRQCSSPTRFQPRSPVYFPATPFPAPTAPCPRTTSPPADAAPAESGDQSAPLPPPTPVRRIPREPPVPATRP